MKAILALIYRDLLLQPRKKFFRWKRVAFVLLVFVILASSILNRSSYADNSTLGLQAVVTFAIIVTILITFMAPATAALLISKENEQNTLGLLLLSDLNPWRIVIGKFCLHVLLLLLSCLSCLPLLIVSVSMGGISTRQVLAVVGILLSLVLLGGGIGLYASLNAKSRNAQGNAVGLMLLFFIAGGICYLLADRVPQNTKIRDMLVTFSPVVALVYALRDRAIHYSFANAVFNSIMIFPLLALTAKSLPKSYIRNQNTPWSLRLKRSMQRKFNNKTRAPRIRGNVIAWYDYHKVYGGKISAWVKGVICFVFMMVLFGIAWKSSSRYDNWRSIANIQAFCFVTMMICVFLTAANGATRAFFKEKEHKTLELLLLTSLSSAEIIAGKLLAIAKNIFPYLLLGILSGGLFVIFAVSANHYKEVMLFTIIGAIWTSGYLALVVSLGLYFSLRTKTLAKAQGCMLLTLMIWHMLSTPLGFMVFKKIIVFSWILWGVGYWIVAYLLLVQTADKLRRY